MTLHGKTFYFTSAATVGQLSKYFFNGWRKRIIFILRFGTDEAKYSITGCWAIPYNEYCSWSLSPWAEPTWTNLLRHTFQSYVWSICILINISFFFSWKLLSFLEVMESETTKKFISTKFFTDSISFVLRFVRVVIYRPFIKVARLFNRCRVHRF